MQNLDEASDSKLRLRTFYRTYFPFPGCVLEGLEFNHGSNTSKPLITVPLSPSQEVFATRPRCWSACCDEDITALRIRSGKARDGLIATFLIWALGSRRES